MITRNNLKPKQKAFVELYLKNTSVEECAKVLQVGKSTLFLWLRTGLRQVIQEIKDEEFKRVVEAYKTSLIKVCEYLNSVLDGNEKTETKIKACTLLLNGGFKALENDIMDRLNDLEKSVKK